MSPILDPAILRVILTISGFLTNFAAYFVHFSKGIGAVLVLIVVAKEAYKMMAEHKSFDLLFWIRPLLLSFAISTWPAIPLAINGACSFFEKKAQAQYQYWDNMLGALRQEKIDLMSKKWDELLNASSEIEASKKAIESNSKGEEEGGLTLNPSTWKESISKSFDNVKQSIINYTKVIVLQLSTWVERLLEWIGNVIWMIAVFCTLFAKELSIGFLIIFGPISFGFSVLGLWKDAWATWFTRFFSFQFYGFVAYLIMACSLQIIQLGLKSDIAILKQPGFPEAFSFNAAYTLFGYLIGAFAMKMVPEIVSWIVPTNSSQAASHFSSGLAAAAAAPLAFAGGKMSNAAWSKGTGAMTSVAGGATGLASKGVHAAYNKISGRPPKGESGQSNSGGSSMPPKGGGSSVPPKGGGSSAGSSK